MGHGQKSTSQAVNEMKKVFLYAYDGQNFGDDLFIATITKRYPHVQFYMWSDVINRQNFRCLPNLKVLEKNSAFTRVLGKIRPSLVARYRDWREQHCQAVVYIGGSIFMEYDSWPQVLNWWEYMADNRAFYVMGANFGPYHTEAYRERIAQIYGKMKDICFRDQYSYDLFRQVKTVRRAPDVLFSYPIPQMQVNPKQIFVSVINCAARETSHSMAQYDADYVENMARLLMKYRREGYRLILSSFSGPEGDEEGIRKILKAMGAEAAEDIQQLNYDGTNAEALTDAIARSEFVVATRFHAMVLAIAAGRPVLPVAYSDKTIHVLEDLGFRGSVIDLRTCEDYAAAGYPEGFAGDRAKLALEAQKHFEKLDEILM